MTDIRTIIIITDNRQQFALAASLLRDEGFCVLFTATSSQGIRLAKADRPHLIVSELARDQIDGLDLCRRVSRDKALSGIPVLIVGDLSRGSSIVKDALLCSASEYLQKPVEQLNIYNKCSRLAGTINSYDGDASGTTFRSMIENVSDVITIMGADGTILFESPSVLKVTGYSPEELVGKNVFDGIHKDDFAVVHSNFVGAIEAFSSSPPTEFRVRHKDGTWKYIESIAKPFNDPTHGTSIVVTSRDTTERRGAVRDREESDSRVNSIFENAAIGIMLVERSRRIVKSNRVFQKMLGYTESELEQMTVHDLTYFDSSDESASLTEAVFAGKIDRFTTEKQYVTKSGEIRWVRLNVTAVLNSKKKPNHAVGMIEDITAAKIANERATSDYIQLLDRLSTLGQRLGASRDLRSVFDSVIDFATSSIPCSSLSISLYHQENSSREAIYLWNNGDEGDVQDLRSMPIGNGPVSLAIATDEVVIIDEFTGAGITETAWRLASVENQEAEMTSLIISPMKAMGKVIGVLELRCSEKAAYTQEHATTVRMAANLIANAIENVRLIELEQDRAEHYRQTQRLESVGRLAGGIAHDFNNMLTAINGYSDLTLRKLSKDDPMKLRSNIEEIKKAGDRSATLTQQLLAFSRRQVLKPKMLDLNTVVSDTSGMLGRVIGEDISLELVLSEDLGPVEADPVQISQVIMNLAMNSRDAMPSGGRITIETVNQHLDEGYASKHSVIKPGPYVMLAVSDTGTGISSENQKHLFEPFFTTKEIGKGTGLGLATVYGIVKQSGGYVWAYSEEGLGTTFKVYLPRADKPVSELHLDDQANNDMKGSEKILLVEDEELVRDLSRKILESCGYTVTEARNGAEALEMYRNGNDDFALLLTDVVMPKMSGRQLVKHLSDVRPGLKVLYMSGYTDDSVIRNGVISAGENFIQKPFTFNDLAGSVRAMLDNTN